MLGFAPRYRNILGVRNSRSTLIFFQHLSQPILQVLHTHYIPIRWVYILCRVQSRWCPSNCVGAQAGFSCREPRISPSVGLASASAGGQGGGKPTRALAASRLLLRTRLGTAAAQEKTHQEHANKKRSGKRLPSFSNVLRNT